MTVRQISSCSSLVSAPQLAAGVCGAAGQDEADEDAVGVLAAHDVEAEAAALLVEDNLPALPGHQRVMSGVLIFSGILTAN